MKVKTVKLKVQSYILGFTLIELLVVISIIALLATLLLANFNATRSRARDAQRKSDLRNMQTALKLYEDDNSEYPDNSASFEIAGCPTEAGGICVWGGSFMADGQTYMSILPADPLSDRSYYYERDDAATDFYSLKACLENTSDDKCVTPNMDNDFENDCVSDTGLKGCVYIVHP